MTDVPYLYTPGKRPSDRRSFAFDFGTQSEFIRHGNIPAQTVATYTVTCPNNDSTLTLEAAVLSGTIRNPTVVSAYVNGGTSGNVYELLFEVITNLGTHLGRTVLLPVDDL